MNVVIATLYGLTIWLAAIAYAIITEGPWGWVVLAGPLIVSGAAGFLMLLHWLSWTACSAATRWMLARKEAANG